MDSAQPSLEHTTPRLTLRAWRDADRAPFAALNNDPEVMRYFPSLLTREQSDAMVDRLRDRLTAQAWGLWAVERRDTACFIGFVGLATPAWAPPFRVAQHPCVEVGWRLAQQHWHQGFASEAAREALRVGFVDLGLKEIVSFTSVDNTPSRAVMTRLGMVHDGEEFEHPALAEGHPLRRHVLYRLNAQAYQRGEAGADSVTV